MVGLQLLNTMVGPQLLHTMVGPHLNLFQNLPNSQPISSGHEVIHTPAPFSVCFFFLWYRTLHSYKLFWAVCHLFPQRWRTLTYSVSGNHWPGEPRDMSKTTSARKFKSCVFEPPTRRVFSINTSSSNTLALFYQISSQQQHTPFSVNQQERKATPWMGLVDIHIQ